MSPLQQWHTRHMQQHQQLAVRAVAWWSSKERVAAAVAGAINKPRPAQAIGDQHAAAASSCGMQTGSSNCRVWVNGGHDHHPECSICQEELQQQQSASQPASSGSSSRASSPYGSWPVAYDDPFLWRRLMWRLLGKLSPEAQAFYAQYLGMCPHCCSMR